MTIFIKPRPENLEPAHRKAAELFGMQVSRVTKSGAFSIHTESRAKYDEYIEYLKYHLKEEYSTL